MTWQQIVEKVIGYLFILAIVYICSQTILEWDRRRELLIIREELRRDFELDRMELQKQITRLELKLNDSIITHKYRMDVLEKDIIESKHRKLDDNNN